MKFFSLTLTAMIAAASFQGTTADMCEENIPLMVGGSPVGDINIDKVMGGVSIEVEVTGDLTPSTDDDGSPTLMTRVYGSVCCPAPDAAICTPFSQDLDEVVSTSLTVADPSCPSVTEGSFAVSVQADLIKEGGMAAFNALFPTTVNYYLDRSGYDEVDEAASYWNAEIRSPGPLNGVQLDGYCLDNGAGIASDRQYTGILTFDPPVGKIHNPGNLDAAAYCINTWRTGTEYCDASIGCHTLTSSTLQRAIWYIVDDEQSESGLGSYSPEWAQHIRDECLANGDGFEPGCDDYVLVPLITGDRQPLYVYGFLSNWRIPCTADTGSGSVDVECEPTTRTQPGTFGDPHFLSWAGEYFDFMGAGCDVVLAESESFAHGLGFHAHARLKARYDYSFIEAAAIQIGEDIVEMTGYGTYVINGIMDAQLPQTIGNGMYTVTKRSVSEKDVSLNIAKTGHADDIIVALKAFKDLVSVRFMHASRDDFGNVRGIMGNFHEGKHLARDGHTVIGDVNDFGQEWRVLPGQDPELFESPLSKPNQKCSIGKPVSLGRHRRLEGNANMISVEDATKACQHFGAAEAVEACIYDVMAMGDLEAAQAGAV